MDGHDQGRSRISHKLFEAIYKVPVLSALVALCLGEALLTYVKQFARLQTGSCNLLATVFQLG